MIRAEPNYVQMADAWEELDRDIQSLQDAKKDIAGRLREEHGKIIADAFKAAMKIRRMDSEKRAKAEEIDAEAFRILGILAAPRRAPRATREIIKEFDAETGEIIEPETRAASQFPGAATAGGLSADALAPASYPPSAALPPQPIAPEQAAVPSVVNSGAPIPDEAVPAFIRRDHDPLNPNCQKPATCKWARSMASCSTCASAAFAKRKAREEVAA